VKKPLPFLLTTPQGEAARTLLSYVVTLPLPALDSQLLAVVVAGRFPLSVDTLIIGS
jgi:hypothetical protein